MSDRAAGRGWPALTAIGQHTARDPGVPSVGRPLGGERTRGMCWPGTSAGSQGGCERTRGHDTTARGSAFPGEMLRSELLSLSSLTDAV